MQESMFASGLAAWLGCRGLLDWEGLGACGAGCARGTCFRSMSAAVYAGGLKVEFRV